MTEASPPTHDATAGGPTLPPAAPRTVDREAARVLLVDGAGRLLLIHGLDPADPGGGSWWLTPGGGTDPGEDAEHAARRELWEETGLRVDRLDGPVAERTTEFDFDGTRYRQHEVFFVVRLAATEVPVVPAAPTELEDRSVLGHRWWTATELATTTQVVHPDWLGRWLADDQPSPAAGARA